MYMSRIKVTNSFQDIANYSDVDVDNIVVLDKGAENWYLWVYKRLPEDKCSTNLGREILVDEAQNRWRLGMRAKYDEKDIAALSFNLGEQMRSVVEHMEQIYNAVPDNGYNVIRPESFGRINPYEDCSDVIEKMLEMTAFINPLIVLLDGRYFINKEINMTLYEDRYINFVSIVNMEDDNSVLALHNQLMGQDHIEESVDKTRPLIQIGKNAGIKINHNGHKCNMELRNTLVRVCFEKGARMDEFTNSTSLPIKISHTNTLVLIDPKLQ